MTSPKSPRSAQISYASLIGKRAFQLLLLIAVAFSATGAFATTATTTTLSISSTSVPYKTPVTLTATVTAGGSPVTSGLVLFCDATAPFCENNSSLLGMVQLTASSATAVVKIGSGPQGVHSYKAVYRANSTYDTSTSAPVSYTVQGTYGSTTALASSGSVGSYTLAATIAGIGSVQVGPSGTVSFLDTSAGGNVLGTPQNLGPPVLSNTFSQAPNSPFAIGDGLTSIRTVAIASAYLNADDDLDVITGDADQVITVLLGNGDGTFQAKKNYAGCQTGKTLKVQLADFNRDGSTDIALGCSNGNNGGVAILMGNGDGTFKAPVYYATGDLAGLAMGDLNGDGILDLAVTDKLQQDLKILRGNGDGSFQAPATVLTTPKAAHDLVVDDFNNDGNDDLAYVVSTATNGSSLSDLYLALGNGNGTFQTTQLQASQIGEFLTSGDTNGDNKADLVSSTVTLTGPQPTPHITNSMYVLIGKGDGTFKPTVTYISDIPSDPHLTDVNGDGKADIIAGGSYGALVYPGNGDGTFQAYSEPIIGGFSLTYAVNAGDYNNDGNADLIGTDANSPRAAVALSEVRQTADAAALTGIAVFPLGSGIHNVDAHYSGDSVFLSSTSSTVPLLAAPVSTTLALDVSPSTGTLTGQTVTLTATLSPFSVSGPPSTTTDSQIVQFYNGATQIGTGALNNGVATFSTTALPAGSDALKALYPGDTNYNSSTSGVTTVTVSNVLLASSPNPSDFLQSVTLTATVPTGATGTITFKDGGTTLGTAPISSATASMTRSTLTAGSHTLTAVYGGDGSHGGGTSPTVTQVVNKITPTMSVSTTGQSTYLSPVTIIATLPSGTTGTVTFTSGTTTLGTATISGGSAFITTTDLPVGTANPITASYGGDSNYNAAAASTTRTVSKASPSSTLTSSANPSTYGVSVTFTDTLPSSATGTVTFTAGGTTLGTSTLVNGVATISTSTLSVGNPTIVATYNGDGNNNTSVASLVQTVNQATPSITLASSANPSLINQSVTFTATLPTTATGTVLFSNGATTLGTATIANGVAIVSTSSLPLGSNNISAQYSGDTNDNTATGTLTQVINKATPTVTVTTSGPSTWGSSVTITATVPSGVTGDITFTSGALSLGSGTISGGSVTITTSALPVGNDTITASYGGDATNNTATGSVIQVVSKASPTSALTSSLNPSTIGASVTFTDTLAANVTGTVTFKNGATVLGTPTLSSGVATLTTSSLPDGSDVITATYNGDANNNTSTATLTQTVSKNIPTITVSTSGPSIYGQSVTITAQLPAGVTGTVVFSSGATSLGTGTVNGSGAATVSTTILPVGSDPITATYSGDSNNDTVTGTTTQAVSKASPTMTLASSVNPVDAEQPVVLTATLSNSVTGTVTFSEGATALGTSNINGTSTVLTITTLPIGSHNITATYNGDSNNNTATASLTETINKATPTVTVTTSGPSTWGQSVTITASVTVGATGTITITSNGNPIGSGSVSAVGTVTVATSTLPVGTDPILASYGGDSNNNANTGTINQVVSKATPTVTVTTSGPSNSGDTVTITTTLPPGTTGTVIVTSGSTAIGTAAINPSTGIATVTTSTLPIGTDPITSSYGGDSNNNPATGTTTQTVNKIAVNLASSLNPSTYGQDVIFTATLSNSSATGTITFSDGATVLGTTAVSTGAAAIDTSALNAGSHTITAAYSGDTSWGTAASGPLTQTVNKATPTLPPPSVSNPNIPSGTSETITETVPPGVTGPVTFSNGGAVIGTAPIVGGVATITVTDLPVGTNPITASTPGDANNNPATSPATTITVTKSTPAVTLTSSINPSAANQSVVFTATLPSGVTGTVTFSDGATVLGTSPVASGTAAVTASTLTAGTHTITASYPGDSNYNAATSAPLTQNVDKATPTLPAPSVSNPTEQYGGTETITETVPPGVSGPVTFYNGSDPIGTAPIIGGTATITVPNLPVGSNPITATTPADANNNPATSPATVITVTKTTPVLPPPSVSNPNPTPNTPVTITETVPPGVTGPVTFTNGGTTIGTSPVVNGTATITVPSLPIGSNPITASVAETATSNAATSPATTVTVDKTTPVLPPPSVSNSNPTPNTPVTITETVPPGVTGPVTFTNGGTTIGTSPVVNGTATITVPSLPIGSNPITASVAETATSNAATSPATTVTVDKTTPVLPPPSVSTSNPAPNTPVTITETVPSGVTGPVTFSNGATPLGTAPVVNGVATITVPSLPIGSNPITASVAETASANAATSPATNVTVAMSAPTIAIASSLNPAPLNQAVTFTATLSATGATGTVTFSDGSAVLGTGAVNGGVALFTTSALAIGTHTITATYGGDSAYSAAISGPLSQIVGKLPTTTVLSQTVGVQMTSGSVTFTATVSATSPTPTGTITFLDGTTVLGTAALNTNGGVAVAFQLTGTASLTVSTLTGGSHIITAVYSGDNTFLTSTSAPLTNAVHDFTITNSTTGANSQGIFPGDATSYKFTLTPTGTTSFINDVNLTISGLPDGSSYTFSPATVASGAGTTAVTLNIKISDKLQARNSGPQSPASHGSTIALGMLGLLGLGTARRYRRRMPRTLLTLLLLAGSLLPVAALTGCAGGYFTLKPNTYTVTVTGTEGTIQHSATATLVVQ